MAYDFIEQQLTLEDSENNNTFSVLKELSKILVIFLIFLFFSFSLTDRNNFIISAKKLSIKILKSKIAYGHFSFEEEIDRALNADTAGMKSEAIFLYTNAVQLTKN